MAPLKIAIIGAGPSGCALARILSQNSSIYPSLLSVTIFEGESSPNVRAQGGTLDLRQDTGLAALKAANLMSEFDKYARYDGESLIVCDKYLTKYITMTGDKEDKNARAPEIDRFQLRQLLLDSLPEGVVLWGKRLEQVEEEKELGGTGAGSKYALRFRDGSVERDLDLVVGADGAWSRVRPLVSDAQPYFSGVVGYALTVGEASRVCPESVKMINGGNCFAHHDNIMLSQQQMGDGVVQVIIYWVERDGDDRWMQKTNHDSTDVAAVQKFLLEKLNEWDPRLTNAIAKAEPALTNVRSDSLYMLPIDRTSWKHRRGVTLLGDAAHLTTPNGEGVNEALTDAKVLAQEIVDAVSSLQQDKPQSSPQTSDSLSLALDSAVGRFEKEMFARMAKNMPGALAFTNLIYFTPGDLYRNIEKWLLLILSDALPWPRVTVPLAAAAIYTYFFFFRLWHRPRP